MPLLDLRKFRNLRFISRMEKDRCFDFGLSTFPFINIVGYQRAKKPFSKAKVLIINNIPTSHLLRQRPFSHLPCFQQHSGSVRIPGWGGTPFWTFFGDSETKIDENG